MKQKSWSSREIAIRLFFPHRGVVASLAPRKEIALTWGTVLMMLMVFGHEGFHKWGYPKISSLIIYHILYIYIIWRFPEIGLPLIHYRRIFPNLPIQLWGCHVALDGSHGWSRLLGSASLSSITLKITSLPMHSSTRYYVIHLCRKPLDCSSSDGNLSEIWWFCPT